MLVAGREFKSAGHVQRRRAGSIPRQSAAGGAGARLQQCGAPCRSGDGRGTGRGRAGEGQTVTGEKALFSFRMDKVEVVKLEIREEGAVALTR